MTTLSYEKREKNILGTAKKINHRVGSFPRSVAPDTRPDVP